MTFLIEYHHRHNPPPLDHLLMSLETHTDQLIHVHEIGGSYDGSLADLKLDLLPKVEELVGKGDVAESDLMLIMKDDVQLGMDWSERGDGSSGHRSSDDDGQQ